MACDSFSGSTRVKPASAMQAKRLTAATMPPAMSARGIPKRRNIKVKERTTAMRPVEGAAKRRRAGASWRAFLHPGLHPGIDRILHAGQERLDDFVLQLLAQLLPGQERHLELVFDVGQRAWLWDLGP